MVTNCFLLWIDMFSNWLSIVLLEWNSIWLAKKKHVAPKVNWITKWAIDNYVIVYIYFLVAHTNSKQKLKTFLISFQYLRNLTWVLHDITHHFNHNNSCYS